MIYRLVINPPVEQDIEEAAHWYNSQTLGLGLDFLVAISDTLQLLQSNPYLFAARYGDIRLVKVKNFSYTIYYFLEEQTIRIIAVLHSRRDPQTGKDRR